MLTRAFTAQRPHRLHSCYATRQMHGMEPPESGLKEKKETGK